MPPKSQRRSSGSSGLANTYLLAYNLVSAVAWASVLARVAQIAAKEGVQNGKVYEETESYARLVQTGAVAEVLHSLLGTFHSKSILHSML